MILQPLLNLVDLCARRGVRRVVISPGSRSAALTLAFARHPLIETRVIPDERVAGHLALGWAQATGQPVAVVCTSGTAASNLVPAVAEAFFQEVPLLILTADRPPEWAQQQDGQMIFQEGLFGRHVRQSASLPSDYTHPDSRWFIERIVNQFVNGLQTAPYGPVHLNVPIREPFYPEADERFRFDQSPRLLERVPTESRLTTAAWRTLMAEWEEADRVLIAVGQGYWSAELLGVLRVLSDEYGVVVVGDITANLPPDPAFIRHPDAILTASGELTDALTPDLLLTCGQSFVSKNLKLFLRKHRPAVHWHVAETEVLVDTFQTLTRSVPLPAEVFFGELLREIEGPYLRSPDEEEPRPAGYRAEWQRRAARVQRSLHQVLDAAAPFNELRAVREVLGVLPAVGQLHLANSMAVRYANLIGLTAPVTPRVFANRGTSGIDGCLSTAVGAAWATDEPVTALIGDIAFFYDRNALWHPHIPANLRIVLLNNHGGVIFRLIDGPAQQPELEPFFETPHGLTARRTAEDAGLRYLHANGDEGLQQALTTFYTLPGPALLEIETERTENAAVYQTLKDRLRGTL
jgi:2-succinyl-5-enolpyruvyl-6-hydroxy-3-cyclohexene-1-carboxylate synthase